MKIERRLDRRALARQARIVDAGAAAGPAASAAAKQRRTQHRRRGGVGDAHLADREQIAVRRHGPIAEVDGGEKLVDIHAGATVKSRVGRSSSIGTTRRSAPARLAIWLIAAPPASKILHHLRGDRLRIGRDAAHCHAMIAGKHRDGDAIQLWNLAALPARQPGCQLFEAAKTSRRFCQRLPAAA